MARSHQRLEEFSQLLVNPYNTQLRRSRRTSIIILFSTFIQFGSFGLAFYYGSVVVDRGECSFNEMFKSLNAILFCGIMAGIYAGQLPMLEDAAKAVMAVMKLYASFFPHMEADTRRRSSKSEEGEGRDWVAGRG